MAASFEYGLFIRTVVGSLSVVQLHRHKTCGQNQVLQSIAAFKRLFVYRQRFFFRSFRRGKEFHLRQVSCASKPVCHHVRNACGHNNLRKISAGEYFRGNRLHLVGNGINAVVPGFRVGEIEQRLTGNAVVLDYHAVLMRLSVRPGNFRRIVHRVHSALYFVNRYGFKRGTIGERLRHNLGDAVRNVDGNDIFASGERFRFDFQHLFPVVRRGNGNRSEIFRARRGLFHVIAAETGFKFEYFRPARGKRSAAEILPAVFGDARAVLVRYLRIAVEPAHKRTVRVVRFRHG